MWEKGEIARHEQFLLFPPVFSKDLYCRHVKTMAYLGNGKSMWFMNHAPRKADLLASESAKGIDPRQPAQSAQADRNRNFLLFESFLHMIDPF